MAPNSDLLLTDDEIVALALEASRPWPTALPTVEVEDEQDLLAAARRGYRSIAIRGLAEDSSDTATMLAAIRRYAAGASAFVCLYVGTPDGSRSGDALTLDAFPAGDAWLVESVSPIGVHTFSRLTRRELADLARGVVDAAYAYGVTGADPDGEGAVVWVRLLSSGGVDGDVAAAVSVRKDVITRHTGPVLPGEADEVDGARRSGEVRRLLDLASVVVERAGASAPVGSS